MLCLGYLIMCVLIPDLGQSVSPQICFNPWDLLAVCSSPQIRACQCVQSVGPSSSMLIIPDPCQSVAPERQKFDIGCVWAT